MIRQTRCYLFLFVMLSMAGPSQAALWQCNAYDGQNNVWREQSDYQLTALNKAFDLCKKQSKMPGSCQAPKQDCETSRPDLLTNVTRSVWRCAAFDQAANVWFGNPHEHAAEASSAAKASCRANSSLPKTCYSYRFLCRLLHVGVF